MKYVCDVCDYVYDEELGDAEHDLPAGVQSQKDMRLTMTLM